MTQSTQSGYRPPTRSAAPKTKMEGRHAVNWGKTLFVAIVFPLAAIFTGTLLVWLSLAYMIPSWMFFFNSVEAAIYSASESGLYPKAAIGVLSLAGIMGLGNYAVAQFYQSIHVLNKFGIKTGALKDAAIMRYAFYAQEGYVSFAKVFGDAVGGWKGGFGGVILQLWGLLSNNPFGFLGSAINVVAQTMVSEYLIGLTAIAGIIAWEAIRNQVKVAIGQQGISTAPSAENWGSARGDQRPGARDAQPNQQSNNQQRGQSKVEKEFLNISLEDGFWVYSLTRSNGTTQNGDMKAGLKLKVNGQEWISEQKHSNDGGGWTFVPIENAAKSDENTERPQRRSAQTTEEKPKTAPTQPISPQSNPSGPKPDPTTRPTRRSAQAASEENNAEAPRARQKR